MLNKRNYKITPEEKSFGTIYKVEVWNNHGMKRTVYEKDIDKTSEVVYDWWESSEKEYNKMKCEQKVLNNLVKKEL